jgi:hypothetical protein
MKTTSFIPRPDGKFLTYVVNFMKYLFQMLARVGFPETVYQQLAALRNTFAEKLAIAEEPSTQTKVTVEEKNAARSQLEATLRQAIAEYLTHNHLLTDADRDALGLPIHKKKHDPVQPATTFPWIKVSTALIRHLSFDYGGSETSKAKPAGQHGIELAWVIADTKPADISELIHSQFDTRSPLVMEFKEEDRGKMFWFAVRWENTTGQKGPWSEIQSAIIP